LENDILTYDIYFGEDRIPDLIVSAHKTLTYDPGALEKNKIYYWQIVASDGINMTEGPVWNFSTGPNSPPEIPKYPFPVKGDNINTNKVTLSWICVDPNNDQLLYQIYIGRNNRPSLVSNDHKINEYDPGILQSNTIYFWFVRAIDEKGDFTTGPVWHFGCEFMGNLSGTYVDERDGTIYNTIKINNEWWFSENLKYNSINGSSVYNYETLNEDLYGRLYNWESAFKSCPDGWHLPSLDEWENMVNYLGGTTVAGGLLKFDDTDLWKSPNEGADNMSGFKALPGGYMNTGGDFVKLGEEALFWTNSEIATSGGAWASKLFYNDYRLTFTGYYLNNSFSVRCIKDH